MASSRVGESISTRGLPCAIGPGKNGRGIAPCSIKRLTVGMTKANVFPEPVCAEAMRSYLPNSCAIIGSACRWINVGRSRPAACSFCMMSALMYFRATASCQEEIGSGRPSGVRFTGKLSLFTRAEASARLWSARTSKRSTSSSSSSSMSMTSAEGVLSFSPLSLSTSMTASPALLVDSFLLSSAAFEDFFSFSSLSSFPDFFSFLSGASFEDFFSFLCSEVLAASRTFEDAFSFFASAPFEALPLLRLLFSELEHRMSEPLPLGLRFLAAAAAAGAAERAALAAPCLFASEPDSEHCMSEPLPLGLFRLTAIDFFSAALPELLRFALLPLLLPFFLLIFFLPQLLLLLLLRLQLLLLLLLLLLTLRFLPPLLLPLLLLLLLLLLLPLELFFLRFRMHDGVERDLDLGGGLWLFSASSLACAFCSSRSHGLTSTYLPSKK
mmetsp:Transcript_63297/g.110495  ORF Transcript_63297/g.110495 Transcript_63297/m.110495 type:complete len:440 (+) Transcript_63297:1360-2679(+)